MKLENLFDQGKHFSITVTERGSGRRLDQFLSASDLKLSRSQAKNLIEKHRIILNQKPTKPSAHLKVGDTISGTLPEPSPLSLKPESIPLTILYEDSSIIVIDKPSGMVVHPAYGNPSGTLVNALLCHCKDLAGINGILRPGIVHRLDKDTSGAIVVAKDDVDWPAEPLGDLAQGERRAEIAAEQYGIGVQPGQQLAQDPDVIVNVG